MNTNQNPTEPSQAMPALAPQPQMETLSPPSEIDRSATSKMLMRLFDHWQITTEQQLGAMGLSNRTALTRYRKGEPIAASRDPLERAGHLLGIHKNLRLLFPENRDLAYAWIRTRNKAFDNKAPIDVITEWGFAGLLCVRAYLDRQRGL
jgi:uncharacterized protein (DUF2384 family)